MSVFLTKKKEVRMFRRRFTRFLLVVFSLFLCSNVFALTWSNLKAQIGEKYAGFSSEVKDMEMTVEIESKGMKDKGPAESKMFMKGDKYRIETKINMPGGKTPEGMQSVKSIIIFDGKDLWSINPFTGKQKLPSEENTPRRNQIMWWKDLPANGEVLGTEEVGESVCYVVQTWDDEKDSKIKGWIEKESLHLVKLKTEEKEGKTVTVLNSNFENLEDWEIPHTTEVFSGEERISKTVIKSIAANQGLSDDLFNPDKVESQKQSNIQNMMKNFKPGQ